MARHVSDFKKAPNQIVIDLIAFDNPAKPITLGVVDLGVPTAATGQSPVANTELEVTAKDNSGYTGAVVVKYDRLDADGFIAAAGITGELTLPVGDAVNYADLIDETKDITIIMNADSFVFLGSLHVTLHAEDILLSDVITVTTLSGLNYPAPPVGP